MSKTPERILLEWFTQQGVRLDGATPAMVMAAARRALRLGDEEEPRPEADRDRQRERMAERLCAHLRRHDQDPWGDLSEDGKDYWRERADHLLDNGVSVEVPEPVIAPVIAPGTTGWATVIDEEGQPEPGAKVMRLWPRRDGYAWIDFQGRIHPPGRVTGFVPDPEPLSPRVLDDLIRPAVVIGPATRTYVSVEDIRRVLAPYMPKGNTQ